MEDRRSRILEAAETLIRGSGSVDFSMRDLALEAGFSPATTYNLIGTKSTVLYSLLNRSVERLRAGNDKILVQDFTPGRVLAMVEGAVTFFTVDPKFYRPLMRFLEGVPDPVNRPIFMTGAYNFWFNISRNFAIKNPSIMTCSPEKAAQLMHTFFVGSLNVWFHGEINEDEFKTLASDAAYLVFNIGSP